MPGQKRSRWGDGNSEEGTAKKAKTELTAKKLSVKERLAAAKAKKAAAAMAKSIADGSNSISNKKTAKKFDVDFESVTKVSDLASSSINKLSSKEVSKRVFDAEGVGEIVLDSRKKKKKNKENQNEEEAVENIVTSNPYLAHLNLGAGSDEPLDPKLNARKSRPTFSFVKEGSVVERAEKIRAKELEVKNAGYLTGRKAGVVIEDTDTPDHNNNNDNSSSTQSAGDLTAYSNANTLPLRCDIAPPPAIATSSANGLPPVTLVEWWDLEYLPEKSRSEVLRLEKLRGIERVKQKHGEQNLGGGVDKNEPTLTSVMAKHKGLTPADGMILLEQEKKKYHENVKNKTKEGKERIKLAEDAADITANNRFVKAFSLDNSKTAALVQHPVPIKPLGWVDKSDIQPTVYLTKKEQKRARRLRRQDKQAEERDKQALGLIPAPEPKLTLANFMKVLGEQAVVDPSRMERAVQKQVDGRREKHEAENEARKLTPHQRREKAARKLQEDTTSGVNVAVFRVDDMSHRYHRTKVDLNAQQNNLSGVCLEVNDRNGVSCIIVEGGPKAIKRFTRLMTVRMNWRGEGEEESESEEEEDGDEGDGVEGFKRQKFNKENTCSLIWSGLCLQAKFKDFSFQAAATFNMAQKLMNDKGLGDYFKMALSGGGSGDSGGGGFSGVIM